MASPMAALGGNQTAGMSEQEQAMVKMASGIVHVSTFMNISLMIAV